LTWLDRHVDARDAQIAEAAAAEIQAATNAV
jgi:hypothetical protein